MAVPITPLRRRTTPLFNPTGIGQDEGAGNSSNSGGEGGRAAASGEEHGVAASPEAVTGTRDDRQMATHQAPKEPPSEASSSSNDRQSGSSSSPIAPAADKDVINDIDSVSLMSDQHRKRGRRRRSSERPGADENGSNKNNNGFDSQDTVSEQKPISTSASPLSTKLWWQRGEQGEEEGSTQRSRNDSLAMSLPSENSFSRRETLARQPELTIDANVAHQRERQDSYESSSQSSMIKSPAAAFLSSMNERLASPSSNMSSDSAAMSIRGYSMSPQRAVKGTPSAVTSPQGSVARSRFASNNDMQPSSSSFGLAGAAAQIYEGSPAKQYNKKPDEEGGRFGANGRYLLGKAIGFGGFSIIREAWDMGENADTQADMAGESLQPHWHRVAVKIVREHHSTGLADESQAANGHGDDDGSEDELRLWDTLPSHPNLLPLLYHEKVESEDGTYTLLVMPFCEGNLLSYVTSGGSLGEQVALPTLSRAGSIRGSKNNGDFDLSASTHSIVEGQVANMTPSRLPSQGSRTGSGFIPHARREASVGDRLVSIPLSNVLARSFSLSGSGPRSVDSNQAVSHVRRASVRSRPIQGPQSTGVSMEAARDIMRQLTEALLCLHHRASILHGDIKLENVLGQQWLTQARNDGGSDNDVAPRRPVESQHAPRQASTDDEDFDDESPVSASTCWRLADFGLAKRITPEHEDVMREDDHAIAKMEYVVKQARLAHGSDHVRTEPMARTRSTSSQGGAASRLGGGSLAYKAPEAFYDLDDVSDASLASPFAADMWALGCILYALFSGRLPFQDSFEPRLQTKIAQGRWDMPERLRRRQENKARTRTDTQTPSGARHATSFSASTATGPRPMSLQMSLDMQSAASGDMSASLPQLPHEVAGGKNDSMMSVANSMQSIVVHDGSDRNPEGDLDEQVDPESDAEIDGDRDAGIEGTSRDRIAVRAILRGLLNTDPSKRWTIEKLAAAPWIREDMASHTAPAANPSEGPAVHSGRAHDDLPRSLQDIFEAQAAAASSGFEDDHGDVAKPLPYESMANYDTEDSQQTRRGRSSRRPDEYHSHSARPIAIDRSKSRSRSRGGSEREPVAPTWGFDMPAPSAAFHNRREQVESERLRQMEYEMRGRQRQSRSTSADPHGANAPSNHKRASSRGSDQARPASSRKSSRSVSRTRRMEIEHIMPQLSLRRSASGELPAHEASVDEAAASKHMASRSSLWKSPLRARDRLMHMMGASGSGSGNSSSNSSLTPRNKNRNNDQERHDDRNE